MPTTSVQFAANTLIVQCDQTIGSLSFTGTVVANGANQANITSPPFGLILVTKKDATTANYLLLPDAVPFTAMKTYTINGPDNTGTIKITDPNGKTVSSYQQ
ncbi:hypothetical protein ABW20_dc0104500 [Dactylellina cionopaga]|nr:hypothetical protein ABW20_dc0104500 [Dactylellina cionopaga]